MPSRQVAPSGDATNSSAKKRNGLCSALKRCFCGLIDIGKSAYGSDGRWGKCLKVIVFTYQGFMYCLDIVDIFLDYATVAELSGMGFKWHAVWLGVMTTVSFAEELVLKTTQRALGREDDDFKLGGGNDGNSTFNFVATMTLAEFIIFFTEDCTVLVIWWQTGTYSSGSAVAYANLVVTMVSAWLCVVAFVGSIANQMYNWHKDGEKVRYLFLPCATPEDKAGACIMHVGLVWLPLWVFLGIGFWTYVGVYLIGQGVHVFEGNCVPANTTGFNSTVNNSIYVGNSTGGDWVVDCTDWTQLSTAILAIYSVGVIISQGFALIGVLGSNGGIKSLNLKEPWLSHCLPCHDPTKTRSNGVTA